MSIVRPNSPEVFDRVLVRRHRDRAARMTNGHDFLHRVISQRLVERLELINRTFRDALALGDGLGNLSGRRELFSRSLVSTDISESLLRRLAGSTLVVADEEFLPFANGAFDIVMACPTLHWVNDLPGTLLQLRRTLKPDGLFLGAMLGGNTLIELRNVLLEAELETTGGAGPRTSPVADVADAGALLQRAGFALPVVDSDEIHVTYPDMFALMHDLRGMGETNASLARNRTFLRRDTLMSAAARYRELHGDRDGRVSATFQVIWMTGWAPHESQQQALRPGSAVLRLAEALETREQSAGETVFPKD